MVVRALCNPWRLSLELSWSVNVYSTYQRRKLKVGGRAVLRQPGSGRLSYVGPADVSAVVQAWGIFHPYWVSDNGSLFFRVYHYCDSNGNILSSEVMLHHEDMECRLVTHISQDILHRQEPDYGLVPPFLRTYCIIRSQTIIINLRQCDTVAASLSN